MVHKYLLLFYLDTCYSLPLPLLLLGFRCLPSPSAASASAFTAVPLPLLSHPQLTSFHASTFTAIHSASVSASTATAALFPCFCFHSHSLPHCADLRASEDYGTVFFSASVESTPSKCGPGKILCQQTKICGFPYLYSFFIIIQKLLRNFCMVHRLRPTTCSGAHRQHPSA